MFLRWRRRTLSPEKPFRDELLSIERLEERALALAASFTIDPEPAPPRAATSFRASTTTPASCATRTARWPTTSGRGQFVTAAAEWLLDNFHLVDVRDPGHPPASARAPTTAQLPTLASREQAGHTRIYAMAVELVRHSDSRIDRQQLARVHQQLPARRAADDRRALGVAQHAEAGADRKPAAPGRRDAGRRAARGWPPTPTCRAIETARAAPRPRRCRRLDIAVRSSSCCTACASTACGCRRSAPRSRSTSRRRQTTAEAAIRGEHQRQAADQVSVANADHQPAPLLDARLAAVLRVGQPGRAGAAARSGRRVRPHGLPQPRSAAAGGRGARRAERRSAGARRAAEPSRARARPPARGSPADRAAHVGYHLIDRGRRDLETDVAYRPRLAKPASGGSCSRTRRRSISAPIARHDARCWSRWRRATRGAHGASPRLRSPCSRCCCSSRPRDIAIALVQRRRRLGGSAAPAAAPRLLRSAFPTMRARWSSCRRC